MATDRTGTSTSLGIQKYNTSADAPSGLGFNGAMDDIDALIVARVLKPAGIVSGELPVWNGATWVRSSTLAPIGLFPGYEFGYDQITANVPVSGGVETSAGATSVIAAAAHTFDGSLVVAKFSSYTITTFAAVGALVVLCLFEGATEIGRFGIVTSGAAAGGASPFSQEVRFTPTAGSHTYTVYAFQVGGNGQIQAGVGGPGLAAPAFLRVTKV
jgi:hypothetical protein